MKYGSVAKICRNEKCGKSFLAKASLQDRYHHCSKASLDEAREAVQQKYRDIITEHWTTKTKEEIATLCGLSLDGLKKKITEVRASGVVLPTRRKLKANPKTKAPKAPRMPRVAPPPKPKIVKVVKPIKEITSYPSARREPKREPARLPDRVVTTPQKSVRVDKRTIIMVDAHLDEQTVITNWYNKHNI